MWGYAERSVYHVFGDNLGDPIADDLMRLLRSCPAGLTRTDIRDYFQRHASADPPGRLQRPLQDFDRCRLFLPEDWAKDRDRCADVLVIWVGNVASGEKKYFPSNAPADAKLRTLVRVAFRRWNVEHGFRVGKSELGFTHYEGRNYTGPMRRQTLCLRMLTFVAGRTEGLRGEKSGGDDGAGLQRVEPAEPGVAGEAAGDHSPSAQAGCHRLPPAAESGRTRVPSGPPQEKAS